MPQDEIDKRIHVFISHRRNNGFASDEAKDIRNKLANDYGFVVFLDELKLDTGDEWAQVIYNELRQADVLIVLLQKETHLSSWIQREVDMARSIFLPILPLVVEDNIPDENFKEALDRLNLAHIQNTRFNASTIEFDKLAEVIKKRITTAKTDQLNWATQRRLRWQPDKADDHLKVESYPLPYPNNVCQIHVTTGDLTNLRGRDGAPAFDVIVNSENDHMQMARIFEGDRLSSTLRRKGALVNNNTLLLEDDTVQRELDTQVVHNEIYSRPVKAFRVIPTYAGHPDSQLCQTTGARYIFHVATVGVDGLEDYGDLVKPLVNNAKSMRQAVYSVLRAVIKVDSDNGQIFPANLFESDVFLPDDLHLFDRESPQWARMNNDRTSYKKITSVIFPMLGAGHAGLDPQKVIKWMVAALYSFAQDNPREAKMLQVTDIYLCAFAQEHVKMLIDELSSAQKRPQD